MKEIKAYACDFCKKFTRTKQTMINHEAICFRNPETKSCAGCSHYKQEKFDVSNEEGYHFRPICNAGKQLYTASDDNILGYKTTLKTDCGLWKEKEDGL